MRFEMRRGALLRRALAACAAGAALAACGESVAPRDAVATVEVTPTTATLGVGGTLPVTARVLGAGGEQLADRELFWNTSDSAVALVDAHGVITAVSPGSARIAASAEGKSGLVTVTVELTPVARVVVLPAQLSLTVGASATIQAQTLSASGAPLAGRTVLWASSDDQVASVDASGRVTAHALGTATVTALSEGKSATTNVTVVPGAPASMSITPSSVSIAVGGTSQLAATVRDGAGTVIPNAPVTWSVSGSAATVSQSGLVTGVAAGTATITATSGGKSATATVSVTGPPPPASVARVDVAPSSAGVVVGGTVQLTATAYDASGNVLTGRTFTWSTSDAATASVTGSGLVTGRAVGSATISATTGGKSGSASITVTAAPPPPVARVVVTPSSASVSVGATVQLTATAYDAAGGVIPGTVFSWSTSDAGIATVNGNGLVTGAAAGSATITASAGGKSASSAITVTGTGGKLTLRIVSGDGQQEKAGKQLKHPLVVEVVDRSGKGVAAVPVTWSVTSGGGKVSSILTLTDSKGRAQVDWTLGKTKGQQTVTASAVGVGQVTFTAVAQ